MSASPYIEREARIIALGRVIAKKSDRDLARLASYSDFSDETCEAIRREQLRRTIFANQGRKAS